MKHRGLYGQSEGNETRSADSCFQERLADNQSIEGEHVAALRRMVKEKNWGAFNTKLEDLRRAGFSNSRISAMTTSAMAGVRL